MDKSELRDKKIKTMFIFINEHDCWLTPNSLKFFKSLNEFYESKKVLSYKQFGCLRQMYLKIKRKFAHDDVVKEFKKGKEVFISKRSKVCLTSEEFHDLKAKIIGVSGVMELMPDTLYVNYSDTFVRKLTKGQCSDSLDMESWFKTRLHKINEGLFLKENITSRDLKIIQHCHEVAKGLSLKA